MPFLLPLGFLGSPVAASATASVSTSSSGGITFAAAFLTDDMATNNASLYTFSGQTFGSANAARLIVCVVGMNEVGSADAPAFDSVTIGGVTATKVIEKYNDCRVGIFQALVPTGTSGTVTVDLASTAQNCSIGLWRIVTGNQAAQFSSATAGSGISPLTLNPTVPTSGFGVCVGAASNNPHVPTNYTERFENATGESGGSGDGTTSGGDFTASAAITCDFNANSGAVFAFATWGP